MFTADQRVVADRWGPLSPPRGTWPSAQGKSTTGPSGAQPPAAPPQGSVRVPGQPHLVCRPAPAPPSTGQGRWDCMSPTRKITPTVFLQALLGWGFLQDQKPPHLPAAESKHLSAHIRGSGKGGVPQQPPCSHCQEPWGPAASRAEHYPPDAVLGVIRSAPGKCSSPVRLSLSSGLAGDSLAPEPTPSTLAPRPQAATAPSCRLPSRSWLTSSFYKVAATAPAPTAA